MWRVDHSSDRTDFVSYLLVALSMSLLFITFYIQLSFSIDPSLSHYKRRGNDTYVFSVWRTKFCHNSFYCTLVVNIQCEKSLPNIVAIEFHIELYEFNFTDPEPITGIHAIDVNDTRITLTWDVPRGEYDAFEVQYINSDGGYVQNITSLNAITISELKPHRNYTFTLVVRSGSESNYLRRSNPLSASFTTSESYPGRVEKFHPTDIQPSEISFEWSLPRQEQNGIIRRFSITYGLEVSIFFGEMIFLFF